jgi:hypothetical protein
MCIGIDKDHDCLSFHIYIPSHVVPQHLCGPSNFIPTSEDDQTLDSMLEQ